MFQHKTKLLYIDISALSFCFEKKLTHNSELQVLLVVFKLLYQSIVSSIITQKRLLFCCKNIVLRIYKYLTAAVRLFFVRLQTLLQTFKLMNI